MGIMGAGGGIMTVPTLVYVIGVDPILATTYSLFIVGVSSIVGTSHYIRWKLVSYKTAFLFSLHSFIAIFLTRTFILPNIPPTILKVGEWVLTKEVFLLAFFAFIMFFSAYNMISKRHTIGAPIGKRVSIRANYPSFLFKTTMAGVVTGLVGAGGGFLIVPALVLLMQLPMKMAIGTSLFVIGINSLLGFFSSLGHQTIDWIFLTYFTVVAIVGIFLGTFISRFLPAHHLKATFGWFILLMSSFILIKELFFNQ